MDKSKKMTQRIYLDILKVFDDSNATGLECMVSLRAVTVLVLCEIGRRENLTPRQVYRAFLNDLQQGVSLTKVAREESDK